MRERKQRKMRWARLLARDTMSWIWWTNLRLLSNTIPRSLIGLVLQIEKSLMLYLFTGKVPRWSVAHLGVEIGSCHVTDQLKMILRFCWMMLNWKGQEISEYSFKSSANSFTVAEGLMQSVTSLINWINKTGPSTLLWGTPLTTREEERVEPTRTDWVLLHRKAMIQNNKLP